MAEIGPRHYLVVSDLDRNELAAHLGPRQPVDEADDVVGLRGSEAVLRHAEVVGDGLGLDSIDALELAMVISKRYGIKFESSDEENKTIFASVSSLAAHIAEKR